VIKFRDSGAPYATDCECRSKRIFEQSWRQVQLREVARVYKKYDLEKTKINPFVKPVQLGGNGRWLWGKTRQGKTHLTGWLLKTLIETTDTKFNWVRASIQDLFDGWKDRYSQIPEVQKKAMDFLDRVSAAHVIALHDIDKFGNMTASREESFFSLIDDCYEQGKVIIAASNFTIAEFCQRFPLIEARLQTRDGDAPQVSRLRELCDEVKVVFDP
jgi:DNA replication protein DnaC